MNRFVLCLKRPFVWISRIRCRCGYGVHSPFAFGLITDVIYERTPYYIYKDLVKEQKKVAYQKDKHWGYESKKVKRLLFRLVNYSQPSTIIDAGTLSASALYLKAGMRSAEYTSASQLSELFLDADVPIDFLYLHHYKDVDFMQKVFDVCVSRTNQKSVFVIEGIGYTPAMRSLWRRMMEHGKVGVSFDLYDVGILFFDTSKIKQSYVVNF